TTVPKDEQQRRSRIFMTMTKRQMGQKGTLLYDTGRSHHKCYFEQAPEGVTCGGTEKIRIKGRTYESLFAYYRANYPTLAVTDDTPAVKVSFVGLGKPQWVAADRLTARVMNEDLPGALSSVDKIAPASRYEVLQEFWKRLEDKPLGLVAAGFEKGYWR